VCVIGAAGQERLAVAGRGSPGGRRSHDRRRAGAGGGDLLARPSSPTRWLWPMPATRCPRRRVTAAGGPRRCAWCASTSRLRGRRVLVDGGGRHRHLLLDGDVLLRRGAQREGWRPTSRCWSATGYVPGHADSRSTCCAPRRAYDAVRALGCPPAPAGKMERDPHRAAQRRRVGTAGRLHRAVRRGDRIAGWATSAGPTTSPTTPSSVVDLAGGSSGPGVRRRARARAQTGPVRGSLDLRSTASCATRSLP
jgi:hypothetical protein